MYIQKRASVSVRKHLYYMSLPKSKVVPTEAAIMIDIDGTMILPQKALEQLYTTGNKVQLKMDVRVSWAIDRKDSDNNSKDKDKDDNPNTGPRLSLSSFLALIASAAACLFTRKQKQ